VAPATIVVNDLLEGTEGEVLVLDNYQTNTSTSVSSSGGAVTFSVENVVENKINDLNTSFTWIASDPFNGMTRGRTTDLARGVVFDYQAPSYYELEVPAPMRDFTGWERLSLRAAQGTRHPRTTAELANLTFAVTLRDSKGVENSINIGAYRGGVQEPYQRTGFGTGAGWQNEYEVIRIRLQDFQVDGVPIDLSDIVAVRLDFGVEGTSQVGRVSLDDIILVPH